MTRTIAILVVMLAAAPCLAAAVEAGQARAPVKAARRHVDLVICLDTSGSMSGLIESAKQKLWAVVNDCMVTYGATESPFGGVKDSGIGRVNGEMGLRSYCHTQSIVISRLGGRTEPLWYPHSAGKLSRLKRRMRFIWGTSLGRLLS